MDNKHKFHVKIKNIAWRNYILIIREEDFQLKKEKSKSKDLITYSLMNAVLFDESEKADLKIMISTSNYRFFIKPLSIEDKKIILSKLEKIIQKLASKTAFTPDYFEYLKQISKTEEKNPYDALLFKINTFQILMGEIITKLSKFKKTIKDKLTGNLTGEFMSLYNDINSIIIEMKKQFDKIINGVNKYCLANNDNLMSESDSSSEKENNEEKSIIKRHKSNKKNDFYFLKNEILEYYNKDYDFEERVKLKNNIKCPENLIKEMITTYTKKQSSPVYFNEPLSMCQKQCEKFIYIDLLTKASKESNNKPLQMCYISAFIIGEIFTNLGRFLKPFTPILGETFEYYENCQKFRYYAENVKHVPQITAFIGETPDFAYYGDTSNETSFKFLKGSIDLTFKNKINIFFKNSKNNYIYNRPIISVKGILKPPMYSDYSGTTIIQDVNDKNIKLELNFIEQTWSQSILGGFEGKAFSGENQIEYLIRGNWQEEIYITDKDGNNKQILLTLNKNCNYLKNTLEKYCLPSYSCNLNNINEILEINLPKNDSRFRQDIRLLEEGDIQKAQMYKFVYEKKQKKENTDSGHKILFFEEKIDIETDENYYIPNGKYWEMKKDNSLRRNANWNIFEVGEYIKQYEEKEKDKKIEDEKNKKEEEIKKDNGKQKIEENNKNEDKYKNKNKIEEANKNKK